MMLNKLMQICSITLMIALLAFLLIISHSSFVGAEGMRGHGNVDEVIVTVDGDPITRGDILRRIRYAKGDIDPSKMDSETWQGIVQTATKSEIIDKLFLKAARSENMEIDPEKLDMSVDKAKDIPGVQNATEQEFREYVREKMLIEKYKARLVEDITVKDEEVNKYYEENKDSVSMPDRVYLELLSMDKTVDPDALFKRIKEGEDFETVAREDDNNDTSSIERYLRWTAYSTLPTEIQPKLKEGKTGNILEPFLINDTYYIMKILEKRPAGTAGLDEVEDRIRERLRREKETKTILSWYEARVRDVDIKYMGKKGN